MSEMNEKSGSRASGANVTNEMPGAHEGREPDEARERAFKLLDAVGMVDDELVAEAHGDADAASAAGAPVGPAAGAPAEPTAGVPAEPKPVGTPIRASAASATAVPAQPAAKRTRMAGRALAIAACLVVVVGVGFLAFGALQPVGSTPKNSLTAIDEGDYAEADGDVVEYAREEMAVDGAVAMKAESADVATADGAGAMADVAVSGAAFSALAAGSSGGLAVGEPGELNYDYDEGEAFVLTAGEWNDNANWPFFTNLVNAGTITFPSFGIDPRHRVRVTVVDAAGVPLRGEKVVLRDAAGGELWHATSGKDGVAYLFYGEGAEPASVVAGGVEQAVAGGSGGGANAGAVDGQGRRIAGASDDVTITLPSAGAQAPSSLQVMFIVDTTGSMSDEIAYLQKDFASIASDVGSDGVTYSVNFYRDEGDEEEYVTKCNPFTGDIREVQRLLNDEYADGGGDEPEAVVQILSETITDNGSWRDDAAKIAFLVFDAPPHEGTDDAIASAVRSAAERGIRVVPVVSSNASRDTELFGRALAICTDGTYVFLTDDSGVGGSHLEPIIGDYDVELLHDVIVRLIQDAR